MTQLLFLELNEISFDGVAHYCARGMLPNFRRLIDSCGWSVTTSETAYEHLEPWIQWVTAHTGLTFAEHGVFRLGDIVDRDLQQIWESLEQAGLKVGAICPMNAKHRLANPSFFVPDPWTPTNISAGGVLTRLAAAISQGVNDNAQRKIDARSLGSLALGLAAYARPANYGRYLRLAASAMSKPWRRAMFLDLLLADVYLREVSRTQPHFASLFLNAGAHIQHHYMFSSSFYPGPLRNPEWYSPEGADPVLEVYELYDHILGSARDMCPEARIMIATGLHQVPFHEVKFYWRLKNHAVFLARAEVPFVSVEPRMSRDFLIKCADAAQAEAAAKRLSDAVAADGLPLFEVDNRGNDLFVMLTYPRDIPRGFKFSIGKDVYEGFHENVAFVALKNGEHDGRGYFLDTGAPKGHHASEFPLTDLPSIIMRTLGVSSKLQQRDSMSQRLLEQEGVV